MNLCQSIQQSDKCDEVPEGNRDVWENMNYSDFLCKLTNVLININN